MPTPISIFFFSIGRFFFRFRARMSSILKRIHLHDRQLSPKVAQRIEDDPFPEKGACSLAVVVNRSQDGDIENGADSCI